MIRKELIVFFTQEGWKYHEFKLVSQYKITLNLLVRFIRNKIFSHQRKIPEEMYIIGLKHLYRELEYRGINLTQEIAIPAHAHLLMFFPS